MSRTRLMLGSCFALVLALLSGGCAGTAGKTVPFNATAGAHPKTWLADHWAEYLKTPDQCRNCHGSTTDPAQAGGVSQVSCFGCHTKGALHPAGWELPTQHGRLGAELAPVATTAPTVPVMAGFAHCAKCHGATYDGGVAAVSCKACHVRAPHPSKPWFDLSGVKPSHTMVNPVNSSECAKCHTGGTNSDLKPLTPAPAGTAPGCFNATLCHSMGAHTKTWIADHYADYAKNPAQCVACHGSATDPAQAGGISKVSCLTCHTKGVNHPTDAAWATPAQHGQVATQLVPVVTAPPAVPVMAGMAHCAKCHGASFDGGITAVSCKACHKTAPHPAKPWLPGSGPTVVLGHTEVNVTNLPACVQCHARGANSDTKPGTVAPPAGTAPGCSNATLCHG